MKLYDVIKLDLIYSNIKKQELPSSLISKLITLFCPIQTEAKEYEKELINLAEAYGEHDENDVLLRDENGNVKFLQNKYDEFSQKLLNLMDKEIVITAPEVSFSIEELESLVLPPEDFELLFSYISIS